MVKSKNTTCHPMKENSGFTCYTLEQLKKIARILNKRGKNIKISSNKKELWNQINKEMKKECSQEWCWIKTGILSNINDDNLREKTFKPTHPDEWLQNQRAWLSNFDIDSVMEQYEDVYKDFVFLGPVPIDFEDIYTELSNQNLHNLIKNGKRRIGIVFNLDPHWKGGSHWVCMFISIDKDNKGIIAFYDSYGVEPSEEIQDLMSKFISQGISKEPQVFLEPIYNPIQHQHLNSECGMYCINLIINMLKTEGTREDFIQQCNDTIDDDTMNSFRKNFFIDNGRKGI
jgi:hypothetical protein